MNIQDLVYFKHLATTLNFTETASHFYVSQPSISMALQRLEKRFNTVLIARERFQKSMQLTETGEILLRHTDAIIESLETAKQEIQDYRNETVHFGFLPTIAGAILPKLDTSIIFNNQNINIIEEESSDRMYEMVKTGQVPIAIIGSDQPKGTDPDLIEIPLLKQTVALWAKKSHSLSKISNIEACDLNNEAFISLSEGYTHHRLFEQWLETQAIEDANILYTKEIPTALSIAASSKLLAFMAPILVANKEKMTAIEPPNAPYFYIRLIVNRSIQYTPYQETFNKEMIEIAQAFYRENHD